MLLNAARTPAREDDQGNLLRLEEQDRTRWDHTMIARGMSPLRESAAGGQVSEYHLQAGIAAWSCDGKSIINRPIGPGFSRSTIDWWNLMIRLWLRSIAAVAVCKCSRGRPAGLKAVRAIKDREKLASYYLFYSVIGELEMRLNNREAAAEQLRKAFELAETKSERAFL